MKKVTARKTSAATKYIHEEVNKEKVNLTDGSDFGAMVSLRASNSLQVAAAKKKEADWQRQSSQQLPRGRARNPSSDCIPSSCDRLAPTRSPFGGLDNGGRDFSFCGGNAIYIGRSVGGT